MWFLFSLNWACIVQLVFQLCRKFTWKYAKVVQVTTGQQMPSLPWMSWTMGCALKCPSEIFVFLFIVTITGKVIIDQSPSWLYLCDFL